MLTRRSFLAGGSILPFAISSSRPKPRIGRRSKYRACVIGNTGRGGYGHNLHLMWELSPDVEVVALADPDPVGREKRAGEAGAVRSYADYREMLDKEKPDLVSIGPRWTVDHKEYLLACAEVGAHGLIEKPLSVDLAEADAMLQATRSKNLKWAIAFNYRASPVTEQVRRLIMEEGLIGDLLEIRSRGKEDRRAGGEDLIVLGVHCFDLMVYFLGDPEWCAASITTNGHASRPTDCHEATEPLGPVVGDRVQASFGFGRGINSYFGSVKNSDGDRGQWGFDIYGTRGIVTYRMTTIPGTAWLPEPSLSPSKIESCWKPLPGIREPLPGPSSVWHYAPIVHDLIESIEEDRQPRVSLSDGLKAGEMIQAVFESHVQGGRPVRFPLERRVHPLRGWS